MKHFILFTLSIVFFSCLGQENKSERSSLTISPIINKQDGLNKKIIESLTDFLESKNQSLTENPFWLASDFQKYVYPYYDIYLMEESKYGKNFYKPTLMEIIPSDNPSMKIIKLAYIGHHATTNENQLKSIYNFMAQIDGEKVFFSKYLDYASRQWASIVKGSVHYKISPNRKANPIQMEEQIKVIENVCQFFNTSPIPITYYSCRNAKEVFEIKGFDYNTMMYVDSTGGLADFGNIVFSGQNSEIYSHEIIHLYTQNLFPAIDKFIDEGIATYLGGSGHHDYAWHRNKLKFFLDKNPDYKIEEHMDPYERIYFEDQTSIPYLTAALICEMSINKFGKEKLILLLQSEKDLWTRLNEVGLTKQNIGLELRKAINQPVILPF